LFYATTKTEMLLETPKIMH